MATSLDECPDLPTLPRRLASSLSYKFQPFFFYIAGYKVVRVKSIALISH